MPFFKILYFSRKLKRRVSLQVQKRKKSDLSSHRKRAYLFTSKASITLEATIAMTAFILVVVMALGFITLINRQLSVQIENNNNAMIIAKLKFYSESEKKSSGEVDLVKTYPVKIPYINKNIWLTQRSYLKDWTGIDIASSQEVVYITKNGKVYHTTKECSHLSINITKQTYGQLGTIRNCNGGKYTKCTICVNKALTPISKIFVTEDGDRYHTSLQCSGLIRNVITVDKSKIEGMPVCSSCKKE